MASRTISTRVAIEGESEYRQSVLGIKSSIGALKAELGAVKAEFHESANSMDALKAKGEVLNKLHGEQVVRLKAVGEALENAKSVQQEYASRVEAAQAKVAAAKAGLEKMASASGTTRKAQADLTAELEKYEKELAEAERYNEAAQRGVSDWQKELNNAKRDLTKLNGDIKTNDRYLEEARKSADGCATSIDQYGKKIKQADDGTREANASINALTSALAAAGVAVALREIAEALKACSDASIQFESAITGVFKTVDGTDAQLSAISDGIKKLSTEIPATTTQIAAVAEAAGQLGIATDDVLSFTRVMLDLGESTNLSADEAASALAKFANITGTAAADYERLGSAIVGLGNNFATTEADIVGMATRLASAGTLAGMTEADILALATAMSSVGIEAEAGGTAMAQTMAAIEKAVAKGGGSLEEFARISGMSAKEFSTLWKTDAVSAIQSFTAGLGRLDEQGESAVLVLDGLGLSGVRQSNMLKSLALASDTLTGAVSLSSRAWEENTALAEEAGKRYATLESQAAMLENSFTNVQVAIGDALAPALREIAEAGTEGFQWAADFIEQNPWLVQAITGVVTALGALTLGVTGCTLVTKVATPVMAAFNATMAATGGPVLLAASALAGLIVALGTYSASVNGAEERTAALKREMRESAKAYEERRTAIREENADTLAAVSTLEVLAATEQKTAAQKAAMAELVDELNESVPGLTLAYDAQTDSLNMTTEALRGLVEAEARRQLQEEAVGRMVELKKDEARITAELTEAQTGLARAEAELVSIAAQYEKLGGESYAERHISAYKTASAEAGRYRAQIETLTGTLEDARRETAGVEEEYRTYSASAFQAAGAAEGLAEQTEAVGTAAASTGEKVSGLAASLDGAAKSYRDVTDAEAVGVSTAIKLQEEYAKLVEENADLLEQYPELYAALDANNTVQENSAEIAKSVWGIRRQLLIDELEAQAENIRGQITNLQSLKETALDAYGSMAKAAILANGGAAMARANQLLGVEAKSTSPLGPVKQDVEETSAAAQDLQNQLNGVLAQIEKLKNSTVDNYVVGSTSGKTSKSNAKKEKDAAMAELQAWLSDMDHQIYLWGKEGGREAAIAGAYRDMQEAVHKLAEEYREKGYDETSDEIQKLQKLWWGYADALEQQNREAYSRELSALEEALGNEEITWEDYLAGRRQAQADHLREGTQAWKEADREIEEETKRHHEALVKANEAAYGEELDDLKYYRDMDIITEEQYYAELAELRDKYLEENSDKWRSATVELHNYIEKCREEELEAARKAYDKQLRELETALDDRLDAVKAAYTAEVDAIKAHYNEEVSALKKKFSEEKTALKEGYDQAKTAAKEAYDAQKEAAKAAYEEKKKAVQEELKLEKDRLNAVLEGIDAEIQARRELREDEDLDARIAAARKRLENARAQKEYARTDEDRAEWDKEIVRLKEALDKAVRDKEDTAFYREKEEEKEAVREQIGAAEEKADAALEGLKSAYDAQVKELDGAYKVKVRELESQYKADLSALEARQEHELAAAKQTYEENLAAAKADYERRVKEAKADYERDKSRLERDRESAEKGINDKFDRKENGQGGGREYSDIVHAIARENDVSIDVAQDMYEANQRNEGNPDLPHYSDGGYSAGKAVAAAAGAIGAAVAGMVTSVGRSVQNNVRNSASVTIHEASSLTEGQVARTVRKVLDEMGR